MKAFDARFLDLLGADKTQYVIPVYQRAYSWSEKQCVDLWNDIMHAGRSNKTHFIGSILYIPEAAATVTSIKKMLLIDGQQRMTTLSLIMAAFVEYLEEDETRASFLIDMKVSFLRKSYLFNNDDLINDSRYKLILSQDDRETLFSIVGNAAMPEDKSDLILHNYEYFRSRIRAKSFDPKALWNGLQNIIIIDTELNAATDNAQLIFESMNSKGKPLTPIDLIRNFILMSLPDEEQTQLYEGYWHPIERLFGRENENEFNAFIWYWLWLKVPTRKPREDEAYDEFKLYYDDVYEGDTESILGELKEYAVRYSKLFLGREADKELSEAFGNINRLDVKPIRPLMLSLYALFEKGALSRDGFLKLCKVIESYLFRRAVCGRFTTGLNNFFAGMYREMEKQKDVATYVTAMLLVHGRGMTAYFPTDRDFKDAFKTRDCYYRFSKSKYYLERMENIHHPKEPINADGYQIEHVMPQTIENSPEWQKMLGDNWEDIHDRLCNNIGNLTLTGYNQEYSNLPFKDKKELKDTGFDCSPLALNKFIASKDVWNEKTIEDRAELLTNEALKIWAYPGLPSEEVEKYRPAKSKGNTEWTLEDNHPELCADGVCHELYEALCDRIAEDNPDWERYIKKFYVGYRTGGRQLHLAVEGRTGKGGWLALGLPKSVDDLVDPTGICIDKRQQQGFGPGMSTYVALENMDQLPVVMALINQC